MSDRLSVLLIEDDIIDAERVERAFAIVSPTIFDFYHVSRFFDAIQEIKKRSFHVVILDLGLPDSAGLNGVERLMELIPSVPVIVLTGQEDDEEALAGIALGAQEFIDKNAVTPAVLVRTIRHAIKRKQFSLQQLQELNRDSAESKRLGRLSEIVRQTGDAVNASVGRLLNTELSTEQKSFVSKIQQKANESMKAAEEMAPNEEMFVETRELRPRGHRPA